MKRSSGISRRASMALNRLRTEVSPKPSTSSRWIFLLRSCSVKISAGSLTHSVLVEQLDLLLAQPVDIEGAAGDEVLEVLHRLIGAGEFAGAVGARTLLASGNDSRATTSVCERARALLRKRKRLCAARPISTTPSTCGMTSPARWIVTVSPMRTSSRLISSSLCSVAFCTTTPPTVTGSSLATGVSAPVRPTWISISLTIVVAFSAANLCAIAQRGVRETKPSRSCQSRRSTL